MKCHYGLKISVNCSMKCKESITCEKSAFWSIVRYARAQNARADVRAQKIFKCLKCPETCSKLEIWSFTAKWNFDARVRAYATMFACASIYSFDRAWHEVSSQEISFKIDLPFSSYMKFAFFRKWRVDDVTHD